ncbi:hypothetical protein C943_01729 [Mariniradius saccharolyticus AK6]|uniref:Uncharacterized protein n=1 Tax=Mariniradius saccharolyticus AK6 TaxID=1239962 RepID=M7XAS0_9BACT|nr:hypothetical protein C943_01729 [Mariniradius saccharolyticus AK6]
MLKFCDERLQFSQKTLARAFDSCIFNGKSISLFSIRILK